MYRLAALAAAILADMIPALSQNPYLPLWEYIPDGEPYVFEDPDGPFVTCNWRKDNPRLTDGVLGFDPAVFVDDDGRVYGYWGFERSYAAELDPLTMCTVRPGTTGSCSMRRLR